ncbi:MAG: cbb3-type cytochrome c oxidase subunit I, partial [Chloroflexi bacterium]|nr:cbb3-type cytochrome c oxidase subunit I [Chloroflexota bacterium]
PVLAAALFMQILDRVLGTHFFDPQGHGQVLLWQHVFWFYSHPAVYIMILPAMGMVSDIISTFAPN